MPADDGPLTPGQDDFDRELAELISGQSRSGRIRELSAAERSKQAARSAKSARRRQARQDGRRQAGLPVRMISVLVIIAGAGYAVYALHIGRYATTGASATAPTTLASVPTVPASKHPAPGQVTPAFTVADPFAGSPGEGFATGPAGIVPPVAKPVGGFSSAQVASAYLVAKRMLVAANLNWPTLRGERPRAFIRALVPQQRAEFLSGLNLTGLTKQGFTRSTRTWLTSFAPGTTAFVGTVIKVHGYLDSTTATENGAPALRVRFNYLFVYPVQRPGQPQTRMRVVAHLIGHIDFSDLNESGILQPWWLAGGPIVAGARCGTSDGFVHPAFQGSPQGTVAPTGTPVNPYQLRNPQPHGTCQRTTGT